MSTQSEKSSQNTNDSKNNIQIRTAGTMGANKNHNFQISSTIVLGAKKGKKEPKTNFPSHCTLLASVFQTHDSMASTIIM